MGGLLAQRLAAAGRAAGLILIAPAPPWPVLLPFATLVSALPILPTVLAGRPLAPPAVLVGIAFNHVPPNERAALLRTFAPESGRALRDMLFGKLRVQRGAVRCPVLSIGGADDRLISPRTQRKIAAFYGARHEALPDHGHWLVTEPGWQAVPQRMVEWLASGR
jgi:pimeloyl-ACP methyl ester carboxylesterase